MSGSKNEKVRETFVTLAQLSMDSIPSDTKPNSRIRSSAESSSDLTIQFPIHNTLRTLLSSFKSALKQKSYKCIDTCEKQILVIRLNMVDKIKKLMMCRQPPKFIITVNTHEFLSVREVTIKPLKSNSSFSYRESRPFELQEEVKHIYQILIGLQSLLQPPSQEMGELDGEYQQDFFSLDATSYYMFSRMLVDTNYGLGKKMLAVSDKFKGQMQLSTSSKQDLKWLNRALSQISTDLLQGFNCSRKELLEILAYCRKSVEEYFHNRHNQYFANEGLLKYRTLDEYSNQIKELERLMPATCKQLIKLQRSSTSMDIYRLMFMIGLVFKSEVQIRTMSEESIGKCLKIIKNSFSGVINEKSRILRCSGYSEEDYQEFISKFNFDHQVTF